MGAQLMRGARRTSTSEMMSSILMVSLELYDFRLSAKLFRSRVDDMGWCVVWEGGIIVEKIANETRQSQ